MKLGISEIVLILVIIGVILLVFRGMPSPKNNAPTVRVRRLSAPEIEEARIQNARRTRLRALGGAFVVIGLIVLASTLKMFELLLSWYAGAALIIFAGIVVLFLSTRR
jgi:hypothetical protein